MAGTRKMKMNIEILCFLVLSFMTGQAVCVNCISQQNKRVDWFIAYEIPGTMKELPRKSFFYMDAKVPSWTVSYRTLDKSDQAVYNTLNQIYDTSSQCPHSYTTLYNTQNAITHEEELMYLMYNDQRPKSMQQQTLKSSNRGHTKGVIAFDSKSGFWLVHSKPHFPPQRSAGYSWPNKKIEYGQSFLCISMATDTNLNEIGKQLLYNYPDIYDGNFPTSFKKYADMDAAVNGKHVTKDPWFRVTDLTSLDGVSFRSFAKFVNFQQDLYSGLVAPTLESNLLVETWQRKDKMSSSCTGTYKVCNVKCLGFKQPSVTFKATQDHSKWAVTNTTNRIWTCIGDINREESQAKRPGGTICFENKYVWQNFHSLIISYEKCKPDIPPIPPIPPCL